MGMKWFETRKLPTVNPRPFSDLHKHAVFWYHKPGECAGEWYLKLTENRAWCYKYTEERLMYPDDQVLWGL